MYIVLKGHFANCTEVLAWYLGGINHGSPYVEYIPKDCCVILVKSVYI